MDGMGLNITVMSYRGVLYWGIMACPDSIPRLWNLTAAIPPALDELLEAAGEKPAIYRSEEAAAAVRAVGRCDGPTCPAPELEPSRRPSGPRSLRGHGAGATAIDDAPVHTAIGRPERLGCRAGRGSPR